MKYLIGTRGSKLALTQAEYVRDRLIKAYPEDEFEIQVIRTKGDLILDKPLHEIGGKGLFVREIEEKLLSGEIHIGVHSMKDMPEKPAEGLMFTKAWEREDFRDVLILREKTSLEELSCGAVIGTGSLRREIQLKKLRPDLQVTGIRGNVETRLRKMEEEKLDGIVLAAAGLHRLGMKGKITRYLEAEEMIPAPAQGILALEIKKGSEELLAKLNALSDADASVQAEAEREFLREIGGSCHIPVGAVLRKEDEKNYRLDAMFGNKTGSRKAYAKVFGADPKELAGQAAFCIREQMAGTVVLVGAGPGDPELITQKGLSAIQEADCIVYDRLASSQLLEEAKDGCEMIYVGKESHNHTMKQEEINQLLVQKSMEYQKVVRLKGGDVYVFGRGGEEGLYLRKKGVPFEVVPGISSCMAGLAYAGIPITHRGKCLGFHVVTAHNRSDELADIDFEAMARGTETCVFLMGLSKTGEIADRLIAAGMPKDTGVAVISHATTPEQKTCVSDLKHIAEEVKSKGLTSPAIIVAGDVVSLREELNFFEKRPLFGRRFLIPKIGEKSTKLRTLLCRQGAIVDEIQVGKIVNTGKRFSGEQFEDVDWLIFTSKNGVEEFFRSLFDSGLDVRNLFGCKIAAIGRKTAETLSSHGVCADLIPKQFHSDGLAAALSEHFTGSQKVWYIKAKNADGHLGEDLGGICDFEEIVVYENCAVAPEGKENIWADYDGVIFTCASSAERFFAFAGKNPKGCRIYSIGPKTTECLKCQGVEGILEAEQSSYQALAECVLKNND